MSKDKDWADFAIVRPLQIPTYLEGLYTLGFPLKTFTPSRKYDVLDVNALQMLLGEICHHYNLGANAHVSLVDTFKDNRAAEIVVGNTPKHTDARFKSHVFEVRVLRRVTSRGLDYMCYLLAHEIAHAFLHSRDVEDKESELMTDLCACMAGFLPYYDKVYGGDEETTPDKIWNDQKSNLKKGGNEYITKYEFVFVKRAVQGAYALRAGQIIFNLFKRNTT